MNHPPTPSTPLEHSLPLSSIPRQSDGRKSWSAFYSLMKEGDQVRLSKADYPGIHSTANKCGIRLHCNMHHADGTFTITVIACNTRPRWMILAALQTLSDSKLKALYQAAVNGGIFTNPIR